MSTDRELLELAAKAAGYKKYIAEYLGRRSIVLYDVEVYNEIKERRVTAEKIKNWNPLDDDGDALRLAVELQLCINREINCGDDIIEVFGPEADDMSCHCTTESVDGDPHAATRRAIVRAAAEIGRNGRGAGAGDCEMTCGTEFLIFALLIAAIGVVGMLAVIWLARGLSK